jgi:ATP-dependent RNA helicase DHX8/PRP22
MLIIMSSKELYKLELLSLVSRVAQELYNHTKLQDKNLAEFVIALHEQSKTLDVFSTKLGEIGADFPEWFVKNLDRLILTMHPKYKRKKKAEPKTQARKFPGLSVPDQQYKERSPSPPRYPSPPPVGAEPKRRRGPDARPVLYQIYNGTVTNVRDFGAFVLLEGVAGRTEGMIHVSNLTGARVQSATEVVSRNERVKVKVMSIAGTKIGLSLKDVDQRTGADLR